MEIVSSPPPPPPPPPLLLPSIVLFHPDFWTRPGSGGKFKEAEEFLCFVFRKFVAVLRMQCTQYSKVKAY